MTKNRKQNLIRFTLRYRDRQAIEPENACPIINVINVQIFINTYLRSTDLQILHFTSYVKRNVLLK